MEPLIPVVRGKKGPPLIEGWQRASWGDLAQAKAKSNGNCNVGLRLDGYLAIDPDDDEALRICDELEKDGTLPPTVSWRTWRNRTVRIYQIPPKKHLPAPIKPTGSPKLELRMGSGQYVLLPPSFVFDPETNQAGKYEFIPHLDPQSIEPAELPLESLEKLIEIANSGTLSQEDNLKKTSGIAKVNFEKGSRDESIYSVALALRKGGMGEADILAAVEAIGKGCGFSDREIAAKVRSAMKETPRERNLAGDIKDYIEDITGQFDVSRLDRELGIDTALEKKNRRTIIRRLVEAGTIIKDEGRAGVFHKPSDECEILNPFSSNEITEYPLRWPFDIHDCCYIYDNSIVIVAGVKDAGKTAMLLNLAVLNHQHEVSYFNSEMSSGELRGRLNNFGYPQANWDHVEWIGNYNTEYIENLIRPGKMNIIDYLEEPAEVWKLGIQISRIRSKLRGGVAIIGLQKDPGKDVARGGFSTMQKARIYLNLDNKSDHHEATLVVGKLFRGKKSYKGTKWNYKLAEGCKFVSVRRLSPPVDSCIQL